MEAIKYGMLLGVGMVIGIVIIRFAITVLADTILGLAVLIEDYRGGEEMTTERTPSPCEWNPSEHRPAMSDEAPHAKAVWSVGLKPCWHLCDSCARLPEFQRKRRRLCGWDTIRASEVKSGDVVSWASSKKDAGSHYQNDEVHHVVDDKDSRRVVVTCYESGVHVWPYESEVFRAKGDDQ